MRKALRYLGRTHFLAENLSRWCSGYYNAWRHDHTDEMEIMKYYREGTPEFAAPG